MATGFKLLNLSSINFEAEMEQFNIELEDANNKEFYTPGETIKGNVYKFILKEQEPITDLSIQCVGLASAAWPVGGSKKNPAYRHSNGQKYFEFKARLGKKKDESYVNVLPYGFHKFPFIFHLPENIPSSFRCIFGKVEYYCSAVIMRPDKSDLVFTIEIPVWRPTDLNMKDYLKFREPFELEKTKNRKSWYTSGPIGFKLSLQKTGFIVGENIQMVTELFNGGGREIQEIEMTLLESVEISASSRERQWGIFKNVISSLSLPGLEARENLNFQASLDMIPKDMRPLNLQGCRFMKVVRHLQVKMIVPRSSNLIGEMDIVIGTIPFKADLS